MNDDFTASLIANMRDGLEACISNFEKYPDSNVFFHGSMGYLDALNDTKVFHYNEIIVARERINTALTNHNMLMRKQMREQELERLGGH